MSGAAEQVMELNRASKFPDPQPGPTVVQVKRKRNDEPIESLWLEVISRPTKRHAFGIKNLSLDASTDAPDDSAPTKLLFRRVESLSASGVKELSLPQLLEKAKERKRARDESDNQEIKKIKDQDIARTTRFEQVRTSRKQKLNREEDDSGQELFNLYEVVRVDVEAESAEKAARREKSKREAELTEGQLLCNYLPLLREHLPDLAAEIEVTATAPTSATASTDVPAEEYVYDVYTVDEEMEDDDGEGVFYPTIQVSNHSGYDWRESKDSDYDSEDSNDEKNPNNDYPEEDEISEDGIFSEGSSGGYHYTDYDDPYRQGSEEYDTSISDDDNDTRWKPRK